MGLTGIASRLIKKHGRAIEILREAPGEPDGFGGFDSGTVTTYPATAMTAKYAVEFIAGGVLNVGEQLILVAVDGLAITPTTDDRLIMEGEEFRTLTVTPLSPAGEAIFWEMKVLSD